MKAHTRDGKGRVALSRTASHLFIIYLLVMHSAPHKQRSLQDTLQLMTYPHALW